MSEIKVGSVWVTNGGKTVRVKYVGSTHLIYEDLKNTDEQSQLITFFKAAYKPAPVRRTVWLNVYEDHVVKYDSKMDADIGLCKKAGFQQEVELIDPREGEKRMSETKFTPGPWVVGYRSLTVGIPENAKIGGFESLFDIRGWGYFTGSGHGELGMSAEDATSIQEANAHLIAAAPDLYKALEALMEEYSKVIREYKGGDVGSCGDVAYDVAGVALAKARGES